MALNIKPLGDRILVEAVEEKETKKGGIIIPDTAKEKPQEGIVRVLGTGKLDDEGKRIAFEVKVGDRVLVGKYGLYRLSVSFGGRVAEHVDRITVRPGLGQHLVEGLERRRLELRQLAVTCEQGVRRHGLSNDYQSHRR